MSFWKNEQKLERHRFFLEMFSRSSDRVEKRLREQCIYMRVKEVNF